MAKHFVPSYVGNSPVSDVIYINSSQQLSSINVFAGNFANWADTFYPNEVGFQIGYHTETDIWWRQLDDPMKEMTDAIFKRMKNKDQKISVFWVDFTIRWKEFDDLWK
jgi:hypothetical protein